MFIFKLFTLNNIIFYIAYFILIIFNLFLAYKYIYLEQSIYLITNKLNKIEIEFNNPTLNSSLNKNNENMRVADIIMNEIFNDNSCDLNGSCSISSNNTNNTNNTNDTNDKSSLNNIKIQVSCEETPVEIFDLKKENDDKDSIVSSQIDTKKSLTKLNVDKLKAKCEERQLSIEGTKSQLIDRILNYENSKILTEEIVDIE